MIGPEAETAQRGGPGRMAVFVAWVVIALQAIVLTAVLRTRSDVQELRGDVDLLGAAIDVSPLDAVPDLGAAAGASRSAAPSPGPAAPVMGDLPRFLGSGPDPALGRTLDGLEAREYYSDTDVVVDPADGVARAYMVWAHWCPFCQQELPLMTQWHTANASSLAGFELVSVTTAIDDAAANPLVPYLDTNGFPFPVLVDDDGALARQLGVNAFPFWVFTAPDGTVVGRAAGLIESEDLERVFAELHALAQSGTTAVDS